MKTFICARCKESIFKKMKIYKAHPSGLDVCMCPDCFKKPKFIQLKGWKPDVWAEVISFFPAENGGNGMVSFYQYDKEGHSIEDGLITDFKNNLADTQPGVTKPGTYYTSKGKTTIREQHIA